MSLERVVAAGCLVALVVTMASASPAVAADKPEDAAQAAAEAWLKLVDGASYAASWEQAAAQFKGALKQADWVALAGSVRRPLGKLVSRKLKSREYTEKLPGAPDGKYVVLQYDSVFEKKSSAIETVVPVADPDGAWRVSGYFIK